MDFLGVRFMSDSSLCSQRTSVSMAQVAISGIDGWIDGRMDGWTDNVKSIGGP